MRKIKRKILSVILFFALTACLYAQEKVSNVLVVSTSQNLSSGEKEWLLDSVKDKLEVNLQSYTNYSFVSSSDKKIKELQKKSESGSYDAATAIELGKLVSASHAIFLTVRKTGSSYTVTAEFTNLTTGKLLAKSVSSSKTTTDALFNKNNCAVDEITIDLCEKLGIPLTNTQIYVLKNGSESLSDTEQLTYYNEEIANLNKLTKNYDEQIAKLMKSTDLDAVTKKNKLESEKALAEQKKKSAEANKKRLAELEKARKEEAAANAGRTAEQQKKILEVSKQVNDKAAELRKVANENLSVLGKIKVLEAKKAALIDIRSKVKNEQKQIPAQYAKERDEKIAAIKNAPWRTAEKNSDGTVAKEAVEARNQRIQAIKEMSEKDILAAQKEIASSTYESQVDVICEIINDQEQLKEQVFYANTLNKNLVVTIGSYGNNLGGWELKYTVYCDGIELTSGKGVIEYAALENMMPSGMDKFDAIDMYDSLFKCGEPVLIFGVDYTASDIEDKISTYNFSFGSIKAYDTSKVTVDKSGNMTGSFIECNKGETVQKQMKPLNNWKK